MVSNEKKQNMNYNNNNDLWLCAKRSWAILPVITWTFLTWPSMSLYLCVFSLMFYVHFYLRLIFAQNDQKIRWKFANKNKTCTQAEDCIVTGNKSCLRNQNEFGERIHVQSTYTHRSKVHTDTKAHRHQYIGTWMIMEMMGSKQSNDHNHNNSNSTRWAKDTNTNTEGN